MTPILFTIVLPTRNGGEQLKLCVESILAQTYSGFELVILDNVSTDGTTEWLEGLDNARIRIWKGAVALPIEENWKRILEVPNKREFLTTIGHDDILDPTFLDIIVDLIRREPGAGLYTTHFRLIDGAGRFLRSCRPIPARESPSDFLAARLALTRDSFGTGHVLRSQTYEACGGIPAFPKLLYADDALMLAAMGCSYRATAPEECFSYRFDVSSTSGAANPFESIDALEKYAAFLLPRAAEDPQLMRVLHQHAPYHIMRLARGCYRSLLEKPGAVRRSERQRLAKRIAFLLVTMTGDASAQLPFNIGLSVGKLASGSVLAPLCHRVWQLKKPWKSWRQKLAHGY